ncbi:MAG: tetratricopeptide repeat protein [Planctomycetes bacterium]|nr:tetratricopeptide repeat protein [Planctomycetota bacterium]
MTRRLARTQSAGRRAGRINLRVLGILVVSLVAIAGGLVAARYVRNGMIMRASLAAARACEQSGDWAGACKEYRRYLEKRSDDVEVLRAFGRAQLSVRPSAPANMAGAREAFDRILRFAPQDEEAARRTPALRLALHEYEPLILDAGRILAAEPGNLSAKLWLARGQAESGALVEATQTLTRLIESVEADGKLLQRYLRETSDAVDLAAQICLLDGGSDGPARAMRWLDRGAALLPNVAEPLITRARLRRTRNIEPQAARADLEAASNLAHVDPLSWFDLAAEWMEAGDWTAAEAALSGADRTPADEIERRFFDRDDWRVPRFLCMAQLALGRENAADMGEPARRILQEVTTPAQRLRLLPTVARIFLATGNVEQARPVIEEFGRLHRPLQAGADNEAELLEARLAAAEDDAEGVVRRLEPLVSRDPSNAGAWRLLGDAQSRLEDSRSAIRAFAQVLRLRPVDGETALRLAREHMRCGDWPGAIETLRTIDSGSRAEREARRSRLQADVCAAAQPARAADPAVWERLASEVEQLLAADPRRADLHVLAASVALQRGRRADAESILRTAIAGCDQPEPVRLALVSLLTEDKRPADAVAAAREAVNAEPTHRDAVLALGNALRMNGDLDGAIAALEGGAQKCESRRAKRQLILAAARMELSAERRSAALSRLEKLAEAEPSDVRCRSLLLMQPEVLGDEAKTQRLLAELSAAVGETNPMTLLHRAHVLLESQAWRTSQREIVDLLECCIASDPLWPAPALLLGRLHERAGNTAAAEEAYRAALLRNPRSADVADRLLRLLQSAGRGSEVAQVLGKLKLSPTAASRLRLSAAIAGGALESAIDEVQARLATEGDDVESRLLLARLLYQARGDTSAAFEQLDRAEADPQAQLPARHLRIAILQAEGQIDEALVCLNQWVRKEGSTDVLLLRGQFLASAGRNADAEADFKELVAKTRDGMGHVVYGQFLASLGRTDDARRVMREGLALAPDDQSLKRSLMRSLLLGENPADVAAGAALLNELEKESPNDPDLLRVRAFYVRETGGPSGAAEAARLLEKVVALEPGDAEAHGALVTLAIERGDTAAARDFAVRALGMNPNDADLLTLRAACELKLGNFALARELARGVLKQQPDHLDAPVILATAAAKLDDAMAKSEAEACLGKFADSSDSGPAIARAKLLHALGRTTDAIAGLEPLAASKQGDERTELLVLMHDLAITAGRNEQAGKLLEEALAASPTDAGVMRRRLAYLRDAGKWEQLASWLESIDSRDAALRSILLIGATSLTAAPDAKLRTRAVALFDRVIEAGGGDDVRYGQAFALVQVGQVDRAIAVYRTLLEHNPRDVRTLNELSWILCSVKDSPEEALTLANRGLQIAPNHDALLDTRGAIYAAMSGRLGDARADFERAAELRRNQPGPRSRTLLRLAEVLFRQKDFAAARRVLDEADRIQQKQQVLNTQQIEMLDSLKQKVQQAAKGSVTAGAVWGAQGDEQKR